MKLSLPRAEQSARLESLFQISEELKQKQQDKPILASVSFVVAARHISQAPSKLHKALRKAWPKFWNRDHPIIVFREGCISGGRDGVQMPHRSSRDAGPGDEAVPVPAAPPQLPPRSSFDCGRSVRGDVADGCRWTWRAGGFGSGVEDGHKG